MIKILSKNRKNSEQKVRSFSLDKIGVKGKVFCLSMQRSGTSSVGNFFEQWGLKHATQPMSRKQKWPQYWYNGNFEAILNDPVFQEFDVFEDSPFWFPEFYKYLYHKFPDSKFILLHRNSDSWFKSLVRHSHGFAPGHGHIHAKIYRREDDLKWLEDNIDDFRATGPKALTLFDKAAHYKAAYERHNNEVQRFFAKNNPEALFCSELSDPAVWQKLADWVGLPESDKTIMHSHAHKAKTKFTQEHLLQTKTKG